MLTVIKIQLGSKIETENIYKFVMQLASVELGVHNKTQDCTETISFTETKVLNFSMRPPKSETKVSYFILSEIVNVPLSHISSSDKICNLGLASHWGQ